MGFSQLSMSDDDLHFGLDIPAQTAYPSPPSTLTKSKSKPAKRRGQIPTLFTNGPVEDITSPNNHPISLPECDQFSHQPSSQFFFPISPPATVPTTPIDLPSCDIGDGDQSTGLSSHFFDIDRNVTRSGPEILPLFDSPSDDADAFSFRSWSQSVPDDDILKPPAPSRLRSASFFLDEDNFASPLAQTPDLLPCLDLDDDEDDPPILSPSSPRPRHFMELEEEPVSFFSPPSPAPSLLSLPGEDQDVEQASDDSFSDISDLTDLPSLSHSLLLDGVSPNALVPSSPPRPRSPDHEHPFYLDPTYLCHSTFEPSVALQLLDLRKRSQANEKKGKNAEQQLISSIETTQAGVGGAGMVSSRNEIRKQRKREKDRSKEISALLRLKLADLEEQQHHEEADETSPPTSIAKLVEGTGRGGNTSPRLPKLSPAKTVISSLPQLVARMIFRRREAGSGKGPQPPHHSFPSSIPASEKWRARISSPLRRSSKELDIEKEEDDEEDDDDFLSTMKGLPNLDLELDGDM